MKHTGMCLLWMLMILSSGMAWAETIVIAHKDVPETTLSQKELREIFLGKRAQWRDNSAIHPVTVKVKALHSDFLKQYIKKSASKWNAYWKRQVFSGTGTPPKQVDTERDMLDYVAGARGAIGYIDAETSIEDNGVIIIEIQ